MIYVVSSQPHINLSFSFIILWKGVKINLLGKFKERLMSIHTVSSSLLIQQIILYYCTAILTSDWHYSMTATWQTMTARVAPIIWCQVWRISVDIYVVLQWKTKMSMFVRRESERKIEKEREKERRKEKKEKKRKR